MRADLKRSTQTALLNSFPNDLSQDLRVKRRIDLNSLFNRQKLEQLAIPMDRKSDGNPRRGFGFFEDFLCLGKKDFGSECPLFHSACPHSSQISVRRDNAMIHR